MKILHPSFPSGKLSFSLGDKGLWEQPSTTLGLQWACGSATASWVNPNFLPKSLQCYFFPYITSSNVFFFLLLNDHILKPFPIFAYFSESQTFLHCAFYMGPLFPTCSFPVPGQAFIIPAYNIAVIPINWSHPSSKATVVLVGSLGMPGPSPSGPLRFLYPHLPRCLFLFLPIIY